MEIPFLLTLIIFVPLAGAIVVMFIPGSHEMGIKTSSLHFSLVLRDRARLEVSDCALLRPEVESLRRHPDSVLEGLAAPPAPAVSPAAVDPAQIAVWRRGLADPDPRRSRAVVAGLAAHGEAVAGGTPRRRRVADGGRTPAWGVSSRKSRGYRWCSRTGAGWPSSRVRPRTEPCSSVWKKAFVPVTSSLAKTGAGPSGPNT